jgi:PAS domain S-box-containing protein
LLQNFEDSILIAQSMKPELKEKLKELSKDEQSFEQLGQLYNELDEEKSQVEKSLHLLENATQHDYDSILITQLSLDKPGPKIVYVNNGFTEITGYEPGDVIGETPRILQGPKTSRDVLDRLKERLRNGRSFFGQAVNYRKDGSEFVNQWDVHPLRNKEGEITHWVSYQHDITERKRAEKRVVNTHTEFNELREKSKSTLLDLDTDGRIIAANKSFRNLTGYAKDELIGKGIWELFPLKYRNSLKARFDKEFDSGDFHRQKLKGIMKHKKGLPIQVEGTTHVLALKNGPLIRAEISNISLQKRIMEALQKRNEDYGKIIDKATDFTYRVDLQEGEMLLHYVSESFTELTGFPVEKALNQPLIDLVHEEDCEKLHKCLEYAMDGESCTCKYRILTTEGYKPVINYCKPGTCKKDGVEKCVRGAVNFINTGEEEWV